MIDRLSHSAQSNSGPAAPAGLIQIQRKSGEARTLRECLVSGPIADKFFAASAIGMLLGGATIGAHLWLMLNGALSMPESYLWWKTLHAETQFLLFFGLSIAGFMLQAGPKVLQVSRKSSSEFLLVIPAVYLAMVLKFGLQLDRLGDLLLSSAFLAVALQISLLVYLAPRRLLPLGSIAIISLLTFVCIPQLDLSAPATALAAYWGAIAPATLFASQQFILAFLGGEALHSKKALFILYWVALGALILGAVGTLPMQLAIIPALATVVYQFVVSKMWRGLPQLFKNPLAFAFNTGYLWALSGCLLLLFNPGSVDRTVHLWTLGWGSTLLFAVSAQVIQHLAAREFLSRRKIVIGLIIWQLVIFGRGVPLMLIDSALAARIVNTATTIVVVGWVYLVLRACNSIVRAQLEPFRCAGRSGEDQSSAKESGCCGRC